MVHGENTVLVIYDIIEAAQSFSLELLPLMAVRGYHSLNQEGPPMQNEACIGSVSEIFDAEPPHHSRGCIAQAWGVAEVLRVIKDYQLYGTQMVKMDQPKMETAEV